MRKVLLSDCTLTTMDTEKIDVSSVRELFLLLCELPLYGLEMSVRLYQKLRQSGQILPAGRKYFLRIDDLQQVEQYPGFDGYYFCQTSQLTEMPEGSTLFLHLTAEKKPGCLGAQVRRYRLSGLSSFTGIEARESLQAFLQEEPGLELLPQQNGGWGTALLLEWFQLGGIYGTAAFAGAGGCVCIEEILLSLCQRGWLDADMDLSVLQRLCQSYGRLTGRQPASHKPVLGRQIFAVESGIHVDGILKYPRMYEPYPPEQVGLRRIFVAGKHSGRRAIAAKIEEAGLQLSEKQLGYLLDAVHQKSIEQKQSLSDQEFLLLAKKVQEYDRMQNG